MSPNPYQHQLELLRRDLEEQDSAWKQTREGLRRMPDCLHVPRSSMPDHQHGREAFTPGLRV